MARERGGGRGRARGVRARGERDARGRERERAMSFGRIFVRWDDMRVRAEEETSERGVVHRDRVPARVVRVWIVRSRGEVVDARPLRRARGERDAEIVHSSRTRRVYDGEDDGNARRGEARAWSEGTASVKGGGSLFRRDGRARRRADGGLDLRVCGALCATGGFFLEIDIAFQ